jgi:hypothetical protein
MDSLIIVSQFKEFQFLVASLATAGYPTRSATQGRLECHVRADLGLLFAVGGHGKAQLGVQTQHLIEQTPGLQILLAKRSADRTFYPGVWDDQWTLRERRDSCRDPGSGT